MRSHSAWHWNRSTPPGTSQSLLRFDHAHFGVGVLAHQTPQLGETLSAARIKNKKAGTWELLPQHSTPPPVVRAHVWLPPAEMATTPDESPATPTGVELAFFALSRPPLPAGRALRAGPQSALSLANVAPRSSSARLGLGRRAEFGPVEARCQ